MGKRDLPKLGKAARNPARVQKRTSRENTPCNGLIRFLKLLLLPLRAVCVWKHDLAFSKEPSNMSMLSLRDQLAPGEVLS